MLVFYSFILNWYIYFLKNQVNNFILLFYFCSFVKFKYVELNFKIVKNFDSLGNEYNLFSQLVYKGNIVFKIFLFENKWVNSSLRYVDI